MTPILLLLAAAPTSWELGVETNAIGSHTGPTGALMWGEGAHRARLGFGIMSNLESLYAPASFGYRAALLQNRAAGPLLGVGLDAQYFWAADMKPVVRPAPYVDLGLVVRTGRGDVAFTATPSLALLTEPGPGLALRLVYSPDL